MATAAKDGLKALARCARVAVEQGDLKAALSLYTRLEKTAPDDPEWPRRLAEIFRRSGETNKELDALIRCASRHAQRDEFLPALATYKMVLSVDPGHLLAQQLLTELQPHQAVSVMYTDTPERRNDDLLPMASRSTATEPTAAPKMRATAADSLPLDELVLTDIVAGARPANIADNEDGGIHEIPLEDVVSDTDDLLLPIPEPTGEADERDVDPAAVDDHRIHLEQCPLFSSLDPDALRRLVEHVRLVELEAGEELFHQGDPAGALYIVAQGAVVPIAEGSPRTRLAVLETGEFFGEIALFTDQPRNATVEALVDSQLLSVDRPVMWNLIREHAEVLSKLLQFLRERLIQRLIRTSPLFRIFSSTKRSAIAKRFRFLEVADGCTVIDQHRPAEALFILLSGHMDVLHREDGAVEGTEKVLATLGPGELFGEMSLLWREPSLASVIARGKCWLLSLPATSFQEMLDHHPALATLAARIAEERRLKNVRTLRDALGHRDGKAGII